MMTSIYTKGVNLTVFVQFVSSKEIGMVNLLKCSAQTLKPPFLSTWSPFMTAFYARLADESAHTGPDLVFRIDERFNFDRKISG